MARPRGNTALFDLLDDEAVAHGGVVVSPGPSLSSSGPTARSRESVKPPERPLVMSAARAAEDGASATRRRRDSGAAERRPFLEVEDGCVRVSLTSARTAVVVFVALAFAVAAHEFGRRRGDAGGFARGYDAGRSSYAADAMSEIEAARLGPVAPGVVDGLALDAPGAVLDAYAQAVGGDNADMDGQPRWIPGHTYVVAQGFPAGHDADGEQAQAFLASRGIETVLVRFDSGATQLISAQGFNRNDAAQRSLADRLLEQIRDAGTDYFASGGGYRLEGYFATFKGGRW